MKKLLALLALSVCLSAQETVDHSGAVRTRPWRVSPLDPGPCDVGDIYFNSAFAKLRYCAAANTWADLTTVIRGFYVQAASCVGTSASSSFETFVDDAPVPTCVTGTNVVRAALTYSGSPGAYTVGMFTVKVPSGVGGAVTLSIAWRSAGTSGNLKLFAGSSCAAVNGTSTGDEDFSDSSVLTPVSASANAITTSSISLNGCSPGKLLTVRIVRDRSDVADTLASDVDIFGVEGVF